MPDNRKSVSRQHSTKKPKPVFDSPFRKLKSLVREREHSIARAGPTASPLKPGAASSAVDGTFVRVTQTAADERELLRQALEGVRPMVGRKPERIAVQPQ